MSKITRYDCEEDRSCEYEVKAVMQVDPTGYYVRHADHLVYLNEMRMDRDATHAENVNLRQRVDELTTDRDTLREALNALQPQPKVLKECAEGWGHGGFWCGPSYKCWLDPRPKDERD